jgi:protein-disulfide isomerase
MNGGEWDRRNRLMDAVTLLAAGCAVTRSVYILLERSINTRSTSLPVPVESVSGWESYSVEGHRFGSPAALVTIVEFGDYECPVCQSFQPVLQAAKRVFADSLAVVYRHFPLERHPMGQVAARAAECAAQQDRFHPFHEMLYRERAWIGLGAPALESYARAVSVPDSAAFRHCLFDVTDPPAIARDRAAAERLGVRGTPSLLINHQLVSAAPDSATLVSLIRNALDDR